MRVAMMVAGAVAAAGVAAPASAEIFVVNVYGVITGTQYTFPCNPLLPGCFIISPYTGFVSSGQFAIDLLPGANPFTYGSPYSSGLFSGTIVNTNRFLTGLNLTYNKTTCAPGVPTIGCEQTQGSAPTFNVTGGIPEPSSWALMVAGFAAAGLILRRRRIGLAGRQRLRTSSEGAASA